MEEQGRRIQNVFVVLLIVFPLFLTAVVKYAPLFTSRPEIHSVSVVPPRLYGSKDFNDTEEDVTRRLREGIAGIPGIEVRPSPTAGASALGEDVQKIAAAVGADALVITAVTIDSGIIQLNVEIIDAKTKRILYANPFQSSEANYPGMMRAAAAALKRELQR